MLLQNVPIMEGQFDRWEWRGSKNGKSRVKIAYEELEKLRCGKRQIGSSSADFSLIWNSHAPCKAQVMAWRLAWNRLPTINNISKRFEVSVGEKICKCCCTVSESSRHLFLECLQVKEVWNKMIQWIGSCWVLPRSINDHFKSFAGHLGGGKAKKRLGGLWICMVWVIWKWRNSVRFEHGSWDFFRRIETEIKC